MRGARVVVLWCMQHAISAWSQEELAAWHEGSAPLYPHQAEARTPHLVRQRLLTKDPSAYVQVDVGSAAEVYVRSDVDTVTSLAKPTQPVDPCGRQVATPALIQQRMFRRARKELGELIRKDSADSVVRQRTPTRQSSVVSLVDEAVRDGPASTEPDLQHKALHHEVRYIFGKGWIPLRAMLTYFLAPAGLTAAWMHTRSCARARISDASSPEQSGFGPTAFGASVKAAWILSLGVLWLVMAWLLLDNLVTYKVGALSRTLFLGEQASWEERTRLFIVLWILCAASMVGMKSCFPKLKTFFLLPKKLSEAEIVGIACQLEGADNLELFEVDMEEHCFERNCVRWVYHDEVSSYAPAGPDPVPHPCQGTNDPFAALKCHGGLSADNAAKQLSLYGRNAILVPVPTLAGAFLRELASWGSLYQLLMSICILFQRNYPIYALFVAISLGSSALKAFLVRSGVARIAEMAAMDQPAAVKRGGQWVEISSQQLVPGDLIAVEQGRTVPADIALLSGVAALDEAMLTGETMPVQKFSAPADAPDLARCAKKHLLSAGTKVVESGDESSAERSEPVRVGIVVATGALMSRGQLIRDILKPKPVRMRHHAELPVLFAGVAVYAVLLFLFQYSLDDSGSAAMDILVGIFNVMQAFSPLLPAALLTGEAIACQRLKENGVYSLAPPLIVLAGGLRVFCFDKTGTLTEEGLQLLGVQEAAAGHDASHQFQGITDMAKGRRYSLFDMQEEGKRQSMLGAPASQQQVASPLVRAAMASCHTVTFVGGKPVGNPAEVEMFTRSGWSLEATCDSFNHTGERSQDDEKGTGRILRHPDTGERCDVLRQYEFDHHAMLQSVVVETLGKRFAFCKGAYERVQDRLKFAPPNYLQVCELHAKRGCYVLALGCKDLHRSRAEALTVSREEAENGLQFLGLVLFRNEPKPDTAAAVAALKLGAVRMVILTGDNVLTGIHIARKVGLCDPATPFRLAKLNAESELVWTDPDGDDPDSPLSCPQVVQQSRVAARRETIIEQMTLEQTEELAITGAALTWFEKNDPELLSSLLLQIRVFGRVQPMQKVKVVEWHMQRGLITGMCGDGGNDCGALKAAHIGVALSEAEASVVAPFSVSDKSMRSCELLVREGGAALVTSFALFKYLLGMGATFTLVKTTLLAKCLALLPQMAYKYYDLALHPTLIAAITTCKAAPTLTKHRPAQSLLEFQFLGSLFAIMASNLICLGLVWWMLLSAGAEFKHFDGRMAVDPKTKEQMSLSDWWKFADTVEGGVLWVFYVHAAIGVGLAMCHGHRFREAAYRNWRFFVAVPLMLTVPHVCLFTEKNALSCLFRTNCDAQHVALAHQIPILPRFSQEFWYEGFWAAGGSNLIPADIRVGLLVIGLLVILLNQVGQAIVLSWA